MTAIFFDLDGTLTDPKLGITRSIQYALGKLDHPAPPADELTWCIGPPLHASFKTMLGGDDRAALAVSLYRERFGDVGLFENEIYAGVTDTLSALQAAGHRLFVATGKPVIYAERIVAHFGLGGYFDCVFGAELDGRRADKTELLGYALQAASADPSRAVMIGDRSHDMIGARNNAMTAVGVLYGYGSREELLAAGAHQVVAEPSGWLEHVR
jgi:phosphoglycolate phosphatase